MIHYSMFNNHGDRYSPDYDTSDPVVTYSVPGNSAKDLIDFLDIRVGYVVYPCQNFAPDMVVTDTTVCSWYVE